MFSSKMFTRIHVWFGIFWQNQPLDREIWTSPKLMWYPQPIHLRQIVNALTPNELQQIRQPIVHIAGSQTITTSHTCTYKLAPSRNQTKWWHMLKLIIILQEFKIWGHPTITPYTRAIYVTSPAQYSIRGPRNNAQRIGEWTYLSS